MKLPSLWLLIPLTISAFVFRERITAFLFRHWLDKPGAKDISEELAEAAVKGFRFP